MTRAALILFDDDDPPVSILGISWPEFRVRQAVRAGAMHIVVVAGRITPPIVSAIDWAKNMGVSAVLARTAIEIADLFHPEEAVLLMSGAALVEDRSVMALMIAERPTLLCVAADSDPVWELIDARSRWTGLARLDGVQVRGTAAMVGDWDLGSTLLRQAVGANARRTMAGGHDFPWRGDVDDDRAIAARAIIAGSLEKPSGWAGRIVVAPLVRLAAVAARDRLALAARFSLWGAAVPLLAAVALAWAGWPVIAATMLVLGFVVEAFGALAERATGQEPRFAPWRGRFMNAAAAAALAGPVLTPSTDHAPIVLAVVLVVVMFLANRLRRPNEDPPWLADMPGQVIIIGAASAAGMAGLAVGLVVALVHAFTGLAWLQNRLSGVLTPSR